MSESSQAADQVTKEVAQLTMAAAKLAGAGLKNLAALALALAKDHKKLRGKTRLSRLLREGSELKVVPLPKDKIKEFCKEAKRYGILFSAIQENEDGTIDILVRAQDAAKINRVFERINYHGLDEYKKEKDAEKNSTARAASEKDSPLYGQDESRDSSSTGTAEKTKTTSEPEKTSGIHVDGFDSDTPIGRIDYLGGDGQVGYSNEYTYADLKKFQNTIEEDAYYGFPTQVVFYRNAEGKTIPTEFLQKLDSSPHSSIEDQPNQQNLEKTSGVHVDRFDPDTPIGRIDYLGADGQVGYSNEYTYADLEKFQSKTSENSYYGVPTQVVLYRNAEGKTIPTGFLWKLDPPPYSAIEDQPSQQKQSVRPEQQKQPERSEQPEHGKQNVRQKMEQLKKQQHMSSQKAPAKAKNIPLGKER